MMWALEVCTCDSDDPLLFAPSCRYFFNCDLFLGSRKAICACFLYKDEELVKI